MNNSLTVWNNCLDIIRKNVNVQSFKTWFEPIRPVELKDSALTIQVPNKFFYEWLEEHYVSLLKMTIRKELGDRGSLRYQIVLDDKTAKTKPKSVPKVEEPQTGFYKKKVDTRSIKNPFIIPGIKNLRIDSQLNPNYTLDTFIEGDCNRLARSAGLAVAKKPGGTAFNPLVIFGSVGLGKTHLAQAIGNEVVTRFDDKTVLYVTSEKFTNQIIESIRNNAVNDFVNFYQLIDVLIIDDIQFLANKTKTQEIFFHIFNQLHQSGKQLVITTDRPPKDLNGMEERLLSRFKWGLSADLQIPDFETRMAILRTKTRDEEVDVPNDVLEFIAYNIKTNVRELEGVLVSLIAQSSLNQRKIDVDLAREVVQNIVQQVDKEITIDFIQKLVAEHFNIPVAKLSEQTRKREIVIARQLSMYLSKKMTDNSLQSIGKKFGGRDHSTVIYSCRSVEDHLESDESYKNEVTKIEKKIAMSINDA